MITSQTPFRISFFGGGTDYPSYYLKHAGKSLGVSINKYCYLHIRKLPPFFEHKHKIVYSKVELVNDINEITHPAVKTILNYLDIKGGLSILHDGDIPARSGMGSSSAFTVGLLNGLYAQQGKYVSKEKLAKQAIHIEQDIIKENVGSQDQYMTAIGGLNCLEFKKNGDIVSNPIIVSKERYQAFEQSFVLVFTGVSRIASTVAEDQIKKIDNNTDKLFKMKQMVDEAISILTSSKPLDEFGKLLHYTWELKKSLSDKISNSIVDEVYGKAIKSGALGGKLLGAGGGGFMLFFVNQNNRQKVINSLKDYIVVPFEFNTSGTRIIFSTY